MKVLKITGGEKLTGTVRVGGMKNAAVAIIPAALLADGEVTIANIPQISDVKSLDEIISYLGAKVTYENDIMKIDSTNIENKIINENYASKLRASYYLMGILLAKYKKVEINFPGGCAIGERPIDLHLKGFKAMGAKITEDNNKYIIEAEKLEGASIYLDFASVGATVNLMYAAVLADGITIIENAAKEPDIVNIAIFLNNMGAKITGAGTSEIKITGVKKLHSCFQEIIPDRVEAGTYMIAAALLGKNMKIDNIIPEHVDSLISKMNEMGVDVQVGIDHCIISKPNELNAVNVKTLPFPGFPTDLQQPLTVLLSQCNGKSTINETIFENRFQQIKYLNEMRANIHKVSDRVIEIKGPSKLVGKQVVATDLRAGACMVLAGLIAEGETIVTDIEHVLRGYEKIVEKLTNLGAKIEIADI